MRELLDDSAQRTIQILELLSAQEGWTTFADLSAAIGASERTVAEDVSKLRKRWGSNLKIEVSKKNGVRMQNQSTASMAPVFRDLFNGSVALLWIKELLFHPNETVEFYENRLFASRSTLTRLLPKINRALAGRGISIRCKNNRYQLLGRDEAYVRDFCASFLLELFGLDPEACGLVADLSAVRELVLSAMKRTLAPNELTWMLRDDVALLYHMIFYMVSLMREGQGYTVPSDYPVEEEVPAGALESLQIRFPKLTLENLRAIHQHMYNRYRGWTSEVERELIAREIETFLQRVFSAASISPNQEKQDILCFALKSFYLNVKLRVVKTSALYDRIFYFARALRQSNPFLYRAVQENLELLSRKSGLDLVDRIGDCLFWMCLVCPELCRFAKPRTALLIDDFGTAHASFLANFLSDIFCKINSDQFHIEIALYPNGAVSIPAECCDVVITTIPNLPTTHPHVVLISDYPTYENLCEIQKALFHEGPQPPQERAAAGEQRSRL
ncbi:MAG: helix-turn-helix domain-containing protein [Bacillota bacterium]